MYREWLPLKIWCNDLDVTGNIENATKRDNLYK